MRKIVKLFNRWIQRAQIGRPSGLRRHWLKSMFLTAELERRLRIRIARRLAKRKWELPRWRGCAKRLRPLLVSPLAHHRIRFNYISYAEPLVNRCAGERRLACPRAPERSAGLAVFRGRS